MSEVIFYNSLMWGEIIYLKLLSWLCDLLGLAIRESVVLFMETV